MTDSAPQTGDVLNSIVSEALSSPKKTKQPKKKAGRPKAPARVYTFGFSKDDAIANNWEGLPKQAISILSNLSGDLTNIPESDLKDQVSQLAADGTLSTKQDPWRIFQYYRSKMINHGYVTMAKAEA